MNTCKNTYNLFGQDLEIISYNKRFGFSKDANGKEYTVNGVYKQLVIDKNNTVIIEDSEYKSMDYQKEYPLYFVSKDNKKFDYFYFNPNQIFFLGQILFIPDFFITNKKNQKLQLILKEALIIKRLKQYYLDPFLQITVFAIDCSDLADIYIVLEILRETKRYKDAEKSLKTQDGCYLPQYGIELLESAQKELDQVVESKRQMSEIHHNSIQNWLRHKEQEYIGKISENFEGFHSYQREAIIKSVSSIKSASVYKGFLHDLFMGSGKTFIACTFANYLYDYFKTNIQFIIFCPVSVIAQWEDILQKFDLLSNSKIYSWDGISKAKKYLKYDKQYYVIADEAHYAYGNSNRQQQFSDFLDENNLIGSLHLTGTPYNGKTSQIVWVAKCLGHKWGRYPRYFQKILENQEHCGQYVKNELQDCVSTLTLSEALKADKNFKLPKLTKQNIPLELSDPQFNTEYGLRYQDEYEKTLAEIAIKLQLESINQLPMAMQHNYLVVAHRLLKMFERLKVDYILNHSNFPTLMRQGHKIVFFCEYQDTAKLLYKYLSHLNDEFHLSEGNYVLKPQLGLDPEILQQTVGEIKEEIKTMYEELSNIKDLPELARIKQRERHNEIVETIKKKKKELNQLNKELNKLRFSMSLYKKPKEVLEMMNQNDLKSIIKGEYYIDHFEKAIITGSVKQKSRELRQNAFNSKDGKVKFLVCTLGAGGTGLNLQDDCCMCVYLGIGTNFRNFEQSLSRVYRIGQKNDVTLCNIYFSNSTYLPPSVLDQYEQDPNSVDINYQTNIEEALSLLYEQKKLVVSGIKDQKFTQTLLHQKTNQEVFAEYSKVLGLSDFFVEKINNQIESYKSQHFSREQLNTGFGLFG